jgi:hypothetical protein
MYHHANPTEMWRERQLALLREAEDRRLARRLRKARKAHMAHTKRGFRSWHEGWTVRLRRMTTSWGRTAVPFFRA